MYFTYGLSVCVCVCVCVRTYRLCHRITQVWYTCPLRLHVKMRDSSAVKSRVFPSHTSTPIYRDFTEPERPSNKQRYARLHPPVLKGRYFEVALKFLWSSREQPKIKKKKKKKEANVNVGSREDVRGRRGRRDQGILNVKLELKHTVVSQHSRIPFIPLLLSYP